MRKKALIVDDEECIREVLRELLQEDFEIEEAVDGKEAIGKYRLMHPDLVLMDMLLPKMSGLEASKRILNINPQAKIIVVSGQDDDNLEAEVLGMGVCSYHVKPFDLDRFLYDVDNILKDKKVKKVVHY